MKENYTGIEVGKVAGDSYFFQLAYDMLNDEIDKLEAFTESVDKDPQRKKELIVQYKCAKFRYASVSRVYNYLWHGNRVYRKNAIHVDIESCIKNNAELEIILKNAPDVERIDYKLYYGISFIVEEMINEYSKKQLNAEDWENVELEERIGGLRFARECLDNAWKRRKEVIA